MMNKAPDMIVLGSTGSVGQQAVDVARQLNIKINALSANKDVATVEAQAREFSVCACAMNDEQAAKDLKQRLSDTFIKVYSGSDGICEMIECTDSENGNGQVVENSILGEAGLMPTLATLKCGKKLALANKESLVVGGETVMETARKSGNEILPVDSEHCAIFQCLRAGKKEEIKNIILTASGGPFFGYTSEMLKDVTLEKTLAHPTWNMGAKITVDSATLMNKGFEVIEAVHLFGVRPEQIKVVVHRESIIHSAVEYTDNSVIAQLSVPDMRHCVQYALSHPERCEATTDELDLFSLGRLTFAKPDTETFVLLKKAFEVISSGGALPAVLNAVNEEIVSAFLHKKIEFYRIPELVCESLEKYAYSSNVHNLDDILMIASEARKTANDLISQR